MKETINVKLINDYITANNLTKKQFANLCHISVYMLCKILNGYENFDIKYLFRIAKVLNVHIHEMFTKKG